MGVLVAVTDHAAERFRQRVGGSLDPKAEIVRRVARAWAAGRVEEVDRRTIRVHDLVDRSLQFVCRPGDGEVVVVTLWEREDGPAPPRVGREWNRPLRDPEAEPGD